MPVLVRNTESGPTVFSDIPENIAIEWQGKGDPGGEDIQHVPDKVVTENTNFLKALQRGILEVVEASPDVQEKLNRQVAAYRQRKAHTAQAGEEAIDRRQVTEVTEGSVTEFGEVDPKTGKAVETPIPVIIEGRQRQ